MLPPWSMVLSGFELLPKVMSRSAALEQSESELISKVSVTTERYVNIWCLINFQTHIGV